MCSVYIVEGKYTCEVRCECGFARAYLRAPERCPCCGRSWDSWCFEERS